MTLVNRYFFYHRKLDAVYKVSHHFFYFPYMLSGSYSHSCDPNTRVYPVYYDTVPEVSIIPHTEQAES